MPNSRERRAVRCETTPYNPMLASSSASTAKEPTNTKFRRCARSVRAMKSDIGKHVVERLVGIDFSNRGANRRCHRRRVARGLDRHGHAILGSLGIRPIDLRTRIAVQPFVANVTGDADNLHPRHAGHDRNAEALADRALVAEYLARDSLIENANVRAAGDVVIPEGSPGEKRDAESAEIIGAGGAGIDIDSHAASFEFDLEGLCLAAKRKAIDDRGGLHAGDRLDAVDETRQVAPYFRIGSYRVWRDRRRSGDQERDRAGIQGRWRAR